MSHRRHFVCRTTTILMVFRLFTGLLPSIAAVAIAEERDGHQAPNILFVYTDDQRWDAMGVVQALRTETAKYIVYPGHDWVELYDLANDPFETRNLAEDPGAAALLEAMSKRFLEEQQWVNADPSEQPAQQESLDHTPKNRKGE